MTEQEAYDKGYKQGYADRIEMERVLRVEDCNNTDCLNCVLDKIRAEIEQKARPNEIGGRGNGKSIRYVLCMALEIIDKYKAESEVQEE